MSVILKSDAISFILALPQGKPNTKIPLESGPSDNRPRIAQPSQKGPNCQWYAMNILRKRIGPNPSSDHEEARKTEKLCSDFYKSRTVLEKDVKIFIPKLIEGFIKKGWKIDGKLDSIKKLIPVIDALSRTANEGKLDFARVIPYFQEFCNQSEFDTLHTYLQKKYFTSETIIYLKFLDSIGVKPKEQYEAFALDEIRQILSTQNTSSSSANYEQMIPSALSLYPKWEELLKTDTTPLHGFSFIAASKALGFKISSWTPFQPVNKLQECLKLEKALIVAGLYGEALYSNDPFVTETIEEFPVYGWKISDRRKDVPLEKIDRHCVVVVGAAQGGTKGGYVYFIDPKDGSDPKNLLQQKIYKISYENFVSNISDFRGSHCPPSKKSLYGYALYYPC